jgi:predicted glycoside hydrolase/deacetylase ChbG (UPF0249 family)
MTLRHVVLCADDYGLSPGVSRGIRDLLEAGRLTASSCMVVHPEFDSEGQLLAPFLGRADIGLHFTLTADRSAASLMRDAYLGRLNRAKIAGELERQLETFTRVMGRAPDYIDGHQHVHLLPGVREPVVKAAQRIGAAVRSTREPIGAAMLARPSPVEAMFLSWTARPLQALLEENTIATNRGFRGVRTFRETAPYRTLFKRMIAGAQERCLVMCHPGFADATLAGRDPNTRQREDELRYFASDVFPRDLAEEGLVLSRLGDARA